MGSRLQDYRWKVKKAKVSKALCNELKNAISMGYEEEFSNIERHYRGGQKIYHPLVLNQ